LSVAYVAPSNELEQTIAALWQNVLGITSIGVNDNFVALGGHSLLALQIIAQIRSSCEIGFSVKEFYEAGTVARQAAAIVRLLIGEMSPDEVTRIMASAVNVEQRQGAAS
jgi:acyl carrier protein